MASVRTFSLPHYEAYPVHVALFKDVKNASFLRRQLLEANPDYDYAFLDASMILTPHHLLSATFLALHGHLTHRAKTRTPHSELVFRLSPNNNIGESYKKFGIADTTTALIAVKLPLSPSSTASTDEKSTYEKDESITNESVSSHLGSAVEGTSVYKLGGDGGKKGKKGAVNGDGGDVERRKAEEKKDIESVVLGIIALKGS
ncbi:kinase binding protein CGI-121-domain-containing protein [Alternaria alternata]|nr:kinase binding protein CGI-121-domain-containing protein [Alternaria alternata]